MRTPKLATDYSGLSDGELANLATRTMDALRDNLNFPDMVPSFGEYEPVAQDYVAKQAITAKGNASTQQKEEKDEARKALLKMMRAVVSYINNHTEQSSVQLSSGFYSVAERQKLNSPDSSSWTRIVMSSRPAEILLKYEPVRGAYQYERQIASEVDENGEPIWEPLPLVSNSRENFYSPVEDGKTYYFRVRSLNKRGVSAWSPVAKRKVWVE